MDDGLINDKIKKKEKIYIYYFYKTKKQRNMTYIYRMEGVGEILTKSAI